MKYALRFVALGYLAVILALPFSMIVYYTFRDGLGPVWEALTDSDLTAQYWGHSNVSDWRPGSRWEHQRTDGSGIADVVGEPALA